MWLINVNTMKLEQFFGLQIPRYAILSHTWEEEEVLFHELELPSALERKGYEKIRKTCSIAQRHGYEYAWVDTCCIDKRSSAELSEGINSMFQWYQDAGVCYAYLSDLEPSVSSASLDHLANCRWFHRGWTLQELIAPMDLRFYDKNWIFVENKKELATQLALITKIDVEVLLGKSLKKYSVATKMSWAAHRITTRLEDRAYCLLGIFDVGIPLLYGEGERAFVRLQEEIIKRSNDFTIFGWGNQHHDNVSGLLFAPSPAYFAECGNLARYNSRSFDIEFVLTNKGLRIDGRTGFFWVVPEIGGSKQHPAGFAMLLGSTQDANHNSDRTFLILQKTGPNSYLREHVAMLKDLPGYKVISAPMVSLFLKTSGCSSISPDYSDRPLCFQLDKGFCVRKVTPNSHWDHSKQLFLSPVDNRQLVMAALISISLANNPDTNVITVLKHQENAPPQCYIFDENTHSNIATFLFRHQRLGDSSYGITWKDVAEEVPEMFDFLPEVRIRNGASTHIIKMLAREGDLPQISANSVHLVNLSIEKVQSSVPWEDTIRRRGGRLESYRDRPLPSPGGSPAIYSDSRRSGIAKASRRPLTPSDDSEDTDSEEGYPEYIRREPEQSHRDIGNSRLRRGNHDRRHLNERREYEEDYGLTRVSK